MGTTRGAALTVAKYIAAAPPEQRKALKKLRAAIRKSVKGLTERISYGIATFDLDDRPLLYIAQFKSHVSLYPVTKAIAEKHGKAIAPYRHGRGTLRFTLGEKLPIALVEKIARTRAREMR